MKKIFLSYFIFLLHISVGDAIVGGENAPIADYPFLVSINSHVDGDDHICTGSILSRVLIIGAASCYLLEINVSLGNVIVIAGMEDRQGDAMQFVTRHEVSLVIIHPMYSIQDFWANDIAIFKIATPITWSWNRAPVNLPTVPHAKSSLRLTGWGGNPGSELLEESNSNSFQKISVHRHQHFICVRKFGKLLNEHQGCAETQPENSWLTLGDSGSPMSVYKKIYGIVSVISSFKDAPFIYTKVFRYKDWIEEVMRKYPSE